MRYLFQSEYHLRFSSAQFPEILSQLKGKNAPPRVYMLKFKEPVKRYFFWMQDKNESRDEMLAEKLNGYALAEAPLHYRHPPLPSYLQKLPKDEDEEEEGAAAPAGQQGNPLAALL